MHWQCRAEARIGSHRVERINDGWRASMDLPAHQNHQSGAVVVFRDGGDDRLAPHWNTIATISTRPITWRRMMSTPAGVSSVI